MTGEGDFAIIEGVGLCIRHNGEWHSFFASRQCKDDACDWAVSPHLHGPDGSIYGIMPQVEKENK